MTMCPQSAPRRRGPGRRQRGAALLEGVFYVAVMLSAVGVAATLIDDEQSKQRNMLAAAQIRSVTTAAGEYVLENYQTLLGQLEGAATGGFAGDDRTTVLQGRAVMALDPLRLIEAGYLPQNFARSESLRTVLDQEHVLLLRATNPEDPARDPPDFAGTVEIEAVLLTTAPKGRRATSRSGEILGRVGLLTAGIVEEGGVSRGPLGNFEQDLTPWSTLIPEDSFRGITTTVAISGYGVLGGESGTGIRDAFLRCTDMLANGVSQSDATYTACLESNDVQADIILTPYQVAGTWTRPAIRSATLIDCKARDSARADTLEATLLVDCPDVRLTGDLAVEGDFATLGDAAVAGNLTVLIFTQN